MLPSIDPEETVFSWGAKTRVALAVSARHLSLRLFGSARAGQSNDMPSSLAHVETAANISVGNPSTLVRRHTVFGAYIAFADSHRALEVERALFCGQAQKAHMLLGLRTNKVGARHPLRYCRACAEDDRKYLGYSRWIVDQQLPAAWVCRSHQCLLVELETVCRPWQLPMEEARIPKTTSAQMPFCHALAIAAEVGALLARSQGVRTARLREAVLARMVDIGVVGNHARLCEAEVHGAFLRSAIAAFLAGQGRLSKLITNQEWVVAQIRGRHATHPAKWAILWAWLWEAESISTAKDAFSRAIFGEYQQENTVQPSLWNPALDAGAAIAIRRVYEAMHGASTLDEVARLSGTSSGVLRAWMTSHEALRAFWTWRKQAVRSERANRDLTAAAAAGGWASRAELVQRYRGAVDCLQKEDPERLNAILRSLPTTRSRQRPLF
jgi:hypothetical protein